MGGASCWESDRRDVWVGVAPACLWVARLAGSRIVAMFGWGSLPLERRGGGGLSSSPAQAQPRRGFLSAPRCHRGARWDSGRAMKLLPRHPAASKTKPSSLPTRPMAPLLSGFLLAPRSAAIRRGGCGTPPFLLAMHLAESQIAGVLWWRSLLLERSFLACA